MGDHGTLFFEGTEKKFELIVDPSLSSLRGMGQEFWSRIALSCGARILSELRNDHCDAYLLSESSLFVFDRKVVMITCGRTHLPMAVFGILEAVPPENVRFFAYERKNEVFPHLQSTSFFDDVALLNGRLPGRAFKFGDEDDHHLYLFHLRRPYRGDPEDVTVEILMYGIAPELREEFRPAPGGDDRVVRERTGVERILPGFEIDDFLFEPRGYSLNAIRQDRYWTLHVTPNEISSYASFETNHRFEGDLETLVERVVGLFRPRAFDLVRFDHGQELRFPTDPYRLKTRVEYDLDCGYRVRFMSFFRPQSGITRPVELPVV